MNAKKIESGFLSNRVAAIAFLVSMTASAVCLSGCSQPNPEQVKPAMDPRGFPVNPDLSKPTPKYLELTKAGENYFDELKKRPSTFDNDFTQAQASGKKPKMIALPGGLQIQDIEEGWGLTPKPGGVTLIHYTGWLSDGTEFDSSTKKGKPFKFTYGKSEVIIGLEQGLRGMKVGGTRVLVIPPNLAYGARSQGNIPANATLTYKIKLLSTGKGFE